jgi:hypothetical protein
VAAVKVQQALLGLVQTETAALAALDKLQAAAAVVW